MKILMVVALILLAYRFGYEHGIDLGMVQTEHVLGPALYKCVQLVGSNL